METVFVQTIMNGTDTTAHHALEVKHGMQALEFVAVHQSQYGMDSVV